MSDYGQDLLNQGDLFDQDEADQDSLLSDKAVETFNDKSQEFSTVLGPLDSGYGITLANPLRRVLLSSIPGLAIVGIKIKGINNIFASIKGVAEDVENIIINLKKVIFKSNLESFSMNISVSGETVVTAGMFEENQSVEILNPAEYVCSVSSGASFELEVYVRSGIGYVSSDAVEAPEEYIAIDAAFSPVLNVFYEIVPARVGHKIDLEKLNFKIKTNGSVDPQDCFEHACKTIIEHFNRMVSNAQIEEPKISVSDDITDQRWTKKISELGLTGRAKTFVEEENLIYIGDLVRYTVEQISTMRRFGSKTIEDIESALADKFNLKLGVTINNWESIRPVEEE